MSTFHNDWIEEGSWLVGRNEFPATGPKKVKGGGRGSANYQAAIFRVKDNERIPFPSITLAARAHNVSRSCICAALKGRTKSSAGYQWTYQNTEN